MKTKEDFLTEDGEWTCIECGACCLFPGPVTDLPHFARGDGGCRFLRDDMRCEIYKNRPAECYADSSDPELTAEACAWLYNKMAKEVADGVRSPFGRKLKT